MNIYAIIMILFGITYAIAYNLVTRDVRQYIGARFVIWYALIVLMGFVAPTASVYILFAVVVSLATVRDRVDAACRYAFAITLLPQVGWRITIGPSYFGSYEAGDVVGLTLLAAGFMVRGSRAARPRGFTLEDGFALLMLAIFWVARTRFPSASVFVREGVLMAMMIVVPYLLIRTHVRSTEEGRRFLACLMIAGAFLAAFALYERAFGWSLFGSIESRLWAGDTRAKNLAQRGGSQRASLTLSGPLMLSFVLVAIAVAATASRRFVRKRWAWICWIVAIVLGLAVAQSRGNTACLPIAIFAYLLARRKFRLAAVAAATGAAAALVVVVGARFSSTLASFTRSNATGGAAAEGFYDYRQLLLQRGLSEGMKRMWTGDSLNAVLVRLSDIQQGEHIVDLVNSYLTIFLISGLLGFVPFVVMVALMLRKQAIGYRRVADDDLLLLRAAVIAMFVALLLQLSFMSFIDRLPIVLMIVVALARLIGIERRRLFRRTVAARAAPVAAIPSDLAGRAGSTPVGPQRGAAIRSA